MSEMQSALERALQRAERIGKLSPEEARQQKEAKYIPAGRTIAERFLEHGHTVVLADQLAKLEDEGRPIAIGAALLALIGGIDIDDRALMERALEGFKTLSAESVFDVSKEISEIFNQHAAQKKRWYDEHCSEMTAATRERLISLGISGSAVGEINIGNDPQWIQKQAELRSEFNAQLGELKASLSRAVNVS